MPRSPKSTLDNRPRPPTTSLPPLSRLQSYTSLEISSALSNIQNLYFPSPPPLCTCTRNVSLERDIMLSKEMRKVPTKYETWDGGEVPDSGYASEEDDDEEKEEEEEYDIDALRSDAFEREFTIRWLTGFTARSDTWVYASILTLSSSPNPEAWSTDEEAEEEEEESERAKLVDDAAALLASFANNGGEEDSEDSEREKGENKGIPRRFVFPVRPSQTLKSGHETTLPYSPASTSLVVEVELNDEPLLTKDHTSVGLQSWGSSILLAEQLCADPNAWGLRDAERVLELGAGTGLLSIVVAKLLDLSPGISLNDGGYDGRKIKKREVVATDFHPSVLENLQTNAHTNFPSSSSSPSSSPPIAVHKLDWQFPSYDQPPLNEPFDVILAADVVYHPSHARWIKGCVERLLRRPRRLDITPTLSHFTTCTSTSTSTSGYSVEGGTFWLIVAVRSTGRHEGLTDTVNEAFPPLASTILRSPSSSLGDDGGDDGGGANDENGGTRWRLAVLDSKEIGKQAGVGRADELAYMLFKIGWVAVGS